MLRRLFLMLPLALITACTAPEGKDRPQVDLGEFKMGHNVVVATNAKLIPPSRGATAEEWEKVLTEEIDKRFGGYDGDKIYNFGIHVDGYALAIPGIPVVAAPKSVLAVSANVWDDAAQKKLHKKSKRLTVLESFSGNTVIGSGLTTSREEQMRNLARNAARALERWLKENRAEWFGVTDPQDGPSEQDPTTEEVAKVN